MHESDMATGEGSYICGALDADVGHRKWCVLTLTHQLLAQTSMVHYTIF